MPLHDASVNALMDKMAAMEKQRRVLRMRLKELEAKVSFATTEKADLEREAQKMDEEAEQLKTDLETLAREEQHLDVRTVEVADTLRRTEAEEAVQMAATVAEQQTLAKDRASWEEKMAELEALRQTWEEDPVTSACIAALRDEAATLNALKTEKAALTQQRSALESEMEKMRAEQQARLACGGGTNAAPTSLPTFSAVGQSADAEQEAAATAANIDAGPPQNVDEEFKRVEYEWAQVTARHSWTMSSLQREVDALNSRAAELRELLASVETTRQDVARRAEQLRQCLGNNICLQCSPSDG